MSDKSNRQLSVADDVVGRTKELVDAGNARRFVIKKSDNEVVVDVSLTVAIVAAVIAVMFLPLGIWLLIAGVAAAIFMRLKIEIVRVLNDEDTVVMGEAVAMDEDENYSRLDEDFSQESVRKKTK